MPYLHRPSRAAGVTLVELLVVLAIGGVVLSGAIAMVVSHVRASSRLAALLRLQDQCGRVEFLINHEIQQAERASGGDQNETTLDSLTLEIPGMTNAPQITYSLNDQQQLVRTGPEIDALGRLQDIAQGEIPKTHLVAKGVTAFNVDTTNPRTPTYRLSVRDSNGVTYTSGNADGAQCRVRSITS